MMGQSASVLIALATMASAADREVLSVARGQLAIGQSFEIQTADQVYRGQLVDRASGECRIATSSDGIHFSPPGTVYLLGATAGRQSRQMFVMMHEVKVGLKLELGLGGLDEKQRQITSEVKAIKLGE